MDTKCRSCVFASDGSTGNIVYSGLSGPRNVDALYVNLVWDRYGIHKKHSRTPYAELISLHPVGYAGHVVHSSASGSRNSDTLFFVLEWA
jgi:hypothetical protein